MEEKSFDLIEQFTRVEWLLHRYHLQNHMHYGPMGDPRKGQGRVLAILKMQPEISQKELSYLLAMRPQSLGELLVKLEKKGYITRTPSDMDRRVMNIQLTEEGREAAGSTDQEFSFDQLFACLSEEEQKSLSDYLGRIIEVLEARLGDDETEPGFDPREGGGHPFGHHFGGYSHQGGGRGFGGGGPHDPRMDMEMGFHHHRNMSFGFEPDGRSFNRRPGAEPERREQPASPQDQSDEE